MRKKAFSLLLLLLGLFCGLTASAQSSDQKAQVIPVLFPNSSAFTALSDNGLWAVSCGPGDDQSQMFYPYLINAQTGEYTQLWTADDELNSLGISVVDVTNDGNIIVGNRSYIAYRTPANKEEGIEAGEWIIGNIPADAEPGQYEAGVVSSPSYYNVSEGEWHLLPGGGEVTVVTPDGKYIGGWASGGKLGVNYTETPLMWERQADGSYVSLDVESFPDFPVVTGHGYKASQIRISDISPDGNIIAGGMNFSEGSGSYYIYNRTTHETVYPGPNMDDSNIQARVSVNPEAFLSNNGKYLTGMFGGEESAADASASFLYNIETGEFTSYDALASEVDRFGTAVSNTGVVLACSPAVNPLRSVYVRSGKLWVALDELLQSRYGMNFYSLTGYEYTGLVIGISDDEKTIIGQSLTQKSGWIIRLPEPLSEAAASVNPLDYSTVFPSEGSQFSKFSQAQITFNTDAKLSADQVYADLIDAATGKGVRQYKLSAQANGRTFIAGGMPVGLTAGKEYILRFPAGAFVLAADETYKSPQVDVKYVGCEPVPAAAVSISPANSAAVSEISAESPVQIKFNMSVAIASPTTTDPDAGAKAYLYEDGNKTPIAELTVAQSDLSTIYVYPALRRYLNKDKNYHVTLAAGSITDVMGFNPNEEITVNYIGAYVPEVDIDGSLFKDDFNDPSRSMALYLLYEGDDNKPSSVAKEWGFDQENSPWIFVVREDESSDDYCAASHSMYNPSGTSDDWMALPQLQIENEFYHLEFDAQSYKLGRTDSIKVYVLEEDNVYSAPSMPQSLHDKFLSDGELIFKEQLNPGASEEGLEGDWQHFELSLAKYKGKNIYIAFVNDNEDQSAVFLDNVRVFYEGDFYVSANVEQNVVAAESVPVEVLVNVAGDDTYNNLTATCTSGDFITTYEKHDLGWTKDDEVHSFTFPKELPLTAGQATQYTISVTIDGTTVNASGTVNNLAFETTKRVVVEEATGQWCQNCTQGIIALENLDKLYGESVVPIAVHGNGSGQDLLAYDNYCSYLGFTAFPSGAVNRVAICAPIYREDTDGDGTTDIYSFTSPTGNTTFMDFVQSELLSPAVADISAVSAVYDESNGLMQVEGDVKYALDLTALNHNIAFVVLEDDVVSAAQQSNCYNETDPIFGEFGKDGIYGMAAITPNTGFRYNHVARKVADERFGGVAGFIPVEVKANESIAYSHKFNGPDNISNWDNVHVVAMIIDATTGKVVNAATVPASAGTVGIKGVVAEGESQARIGYADGAITVNGADGADVTVYDVNGMLVSRTATVDGAASVSTNGQRGIFIVKVSGENTNVVKKIIVR